MTIKRAIIECPWLPIVALATSQLVGNNREFDVSDIF